MGIRVGVTKLAANLGVSHPSVIRAYKEGRITRGPDGMFDLDEARREWACNTHAVKSEAGRSQRRGPGRPRKYEVAPQDAGAGDAPADINATDGTMAEAVRLREWARLEKERLELQRRRGEVVQLSEVNVFICDMILKVRDGLDRLPEEWGVRLGIPADKVRVIREDLARTLSGIAEYRPAQAA